jgi:hypothetical protein
MLMIPPDTLNSNLSPTLIPALRLNHQSLFIFDNDSH